MFPRTAVFLLVLIVSSGLNAAEPPKEEQGTAHSIEAKVDYPTNAGVGIQAEKQPGQFTIREGMKAKNLKYGFYNPKTGNTHTKLQGNNIFSMTLHRYMTEIDSDPNFELPPGDYKFVIGGQPGASGVLNFTTVPMPKKPPTDATQGKLHTVEATVDYPTNAGVGIQAGIQPGEFSIPKGSKATDFKYNFFNPKTSRTLTTLQGNNIYSMTQHRYMKEFDANPNFELPAGDYKFVIGGQPGAKGTLTYRTIPASNDAPPVEPPTTSHSGYDWLYQGVWLPERYFPAGYRHYPEDKMPPGDPAIGNGTQSLWFGIPLKSKGGRPSTSAGEHPYTVFIDGIWVFKSETLAKKMFQQMKSGPPSKTAIALGDEAYIDDNCKDAGSLFQEFRDKSGNVYTRNLNVRSIRVGRVVFGLRVSGDYVRDYDPNVPNSRHFIAHQVPSPEDILQVAKTFVSRIQAYGNDKGWMKP